MGDSMGFSQWYQGKITDDNNVARNAFLSVKVKLALCETSDHRQRELLGGDTSLEDVQEQVSQSLGNYLYKRDGSKVRECLHRVSETICHYGTVLDVFVQHHPEYVSLAWGTMKLLFASVENHATTLKVLAGALDQVAGCLPRVKIRSILYPTDAMRESVEHLYADILKFLLRADSFCHESKLGHILHSVTRPPKLRYDDLIRSITRRSDEIMELAGLGSQCELRVMHQTQGQKLHSLEEAAINAGKDQKALAESVVKLEVLNKKQCEKIDVVVSVLREHGLTMGDLVAKIENFHAVQTSALLDTNQKLSGLQVSQALSALSFAFEDPHEVYERHACLRRRRAKGGGLRSVATEPFWLSPKLARLSTTDDSVGGMVTIKGAFALRFKLQDFAVDAIRLLSASRIPTIWALSGLARGGAWSTAELLKYLTYQALRLRSSEGQDTTESQMAFRSARFGTAQTCADWRALLAEILSSMSGPVYFVIDLAAARPLEANDGTDFVRGLHKLLAELSARAHRVTIRAIMLAYDMSWLACLPSEMSRSTVAVRKSGKKPPSVVMQQERSMQDRLFPKPAGQDKKRTARGSRR